MRRRLRRAAAAILGEDRDRRLDAIERRIEALETRVAKTEATGHQTAQHATSATATAEAAIDGVTGVEDRLAALLEKLGAS